MERKALQKWVHRIPDNQYFSREHFSKNECFNLTVIEFEAMRLKHYGRITQEKAAKKMGISQPTFSRILGSAHEKITKALIEGKKIKINVEDHDYTVSFTGYGCLDCSHEWEDISASKDKKVICVRCFSKHVYYLVKY